MRTIRFSMTILRLALAGAALLVLTALGTGRASADSITYKGISLTPSILNVDVQKDAAETNFTIYATNNTRAKQVLYLSSLDFKSLNETGGLTFIGNDVNKLTYKYGLASWLNISTAPVELAPNETKGVTITVENRADLAPGGHYAAVLFKTTPQSTPGNNNQVAINQVVSSLVFVRKLDGAQYKLDLVKAALPHSLFRMPDSLNVVFRNTGNIQEIPRGIISVLSPRSQEVARGIINTDSSLVLPDSSRLYQVPLKKISSSWLPGRYKVDMQYRPDDSITVQHAAIYFWHISLWQIILPILLVLLAIIMIKKRTFIRRQARHLRLRSR